MVFLSVFLSLWNSKKVWTWMWCVCTCRCYCVFCCCWASFFSPRQLTKPARRDGCASLKRGAPSLTRTYIFSFDIIYGRVMLTTRLVACLTLTKAIWRWSSRVIGKRWGIYFFSHLSCNSCNISPFPYVFANIQYISLRNDPGTLLCCGKGVGLRGLKHGWFLSWQLLAGGEGIVLRFSQLY